MSGKFALIIGNTEYIDPGLSQLTAPGKDAEDFARVLSDKDICAFDTVNILLNQPSSTIIEAIDEFFDQKKPDDMLVLFFSGHGVRDEIGSLYLAVKNTIRSRLRSTAIKSDYIREVMDQSRSRRQVLILDCCNSGAFAQGTKAEVGGTMGMVSAFQGYGRYVLTASDATQFAWEGNKVIGETENSLFTHFLVKGLEGEADSDGDGEITVDELYDYAFEQIVSLTPNQKPNKSATKQEGEIILRQITRIEDIKPMSLPDELIEATVDSRTFVREGAIRELEKLLKGRNLGLARSAREELERIEKEDDSIRVRQAAAHALEAIGRAGQSELQKAGHEPVAAEKAQAEQEAGQTRRAREEAERIALLKARQEQFTREKAEADGLAEEKRLATQSSVAAPERIVRPESVRRQQPILKWAVIGIIGICVIASSAWGLPYLADLINPPATHAPTEPPAAEASATEAPATNPPGPAVGSPEHPIKIFFVPSVDPGVIISSGEIMAQALNEATGLEFEVAVPTSYAATIEEMCASQTDSMGFIPGLGYALASQMCGVDVSFAAARFGYPAYWTEILVPRDSSNQSLTDLNGLTWGLTDFGSTSGYMVPAAMFANAGISPGQKVDNGGHNQNVIALYKGEVDFATVFYLPPLTPNGEPAWAYGDYVAGRVTPDMWDVPAASIPNCAPTADASSLLCNGWRVMDARANIREDYPDVMQKIRILQLSPAVPSDTISFSPEFPDDVRAQIEEALVNFSLTDSWNDSIGDPDFYGWTGIYPMNDREYDIVRKMVEVTGLTLEGLR